MGFDTARYALIQTYYESVGGSLADYGVQEIFRAHAADLGLCDDCLSKLPDPMADPPMPDSLADVETLTAALKGHDLGIVPGLAGKLEDNARRVQAEAIGMVEHDIALWEQAARDGTAGESPSRIAEGRRKRPAVMKAQQ